MNKQILVIALALSSLSLISCSNLPGETQTISEPVGESKIQPKPDTQTQAQINQQASLPKTTSEAEYLEIGTPISLVQGDLMCYATVLDENGTEHQIGASFEICDEAESFLNKKARFVYQEANINDCESIEPCGKTRKEMLITQIIPVDENAQTITNGEWTITIGNSDSWDGVNRTGNLSYYGCDSQGKCLQLTGGTITCREGECFMAWSNGDYDYIVSQPINAEEQKDISTTLTVRQGANVILEATGFQPI